MSDSEDSDDSEYIEVDNNLEKDVDETEEPVEEQVDEDEIGKMKGIRSNQNLTKTKTIP